MIGLGIIDMPDRYPPLRIAVQFSQAHAIGIQIYLVAQPLMLVSAPSTRALLLGAFGLSLPFRFPLIPLPLVILQLASPPFGKGCRLGFGGCGSAFSRLGHDVDR